MSIETADREALELVRSQKANTEKLAQALLARETLTRGEVLELLGMEPSTTALIPA